MPQRTLIISLGSTGADIASGVIDRMLEQRGAFTSKEAFPWVRFVAIDTVPLSSDQGKTGWRLAAENYSVNIGIDNSTAFDNPSQTLSNIDFDKWCDSEMIKRGGAYNVGAALRMRGRLFFLYPESFAKVMSAIEKQIDELRAINLPQEIHTKLNVTNPEVKDSIAVFITGTLGGGTCSGAFVDMAAVIKGFGHGDIESPTGVFLIPHEGSNIEQVANAQFALRELNHYISDGTVYEQKLDHPRFPSSKIRLTEAPYKEVHLLKARNDNKDSIQAPIRSISEFLYLSTCTVESDLFKEKTIDPLVKNATMSFKGNHGRFGSFGTASLIYPADHIARAVSYKIIANALTEWLEKQELPSAEAFNRLAREGFTLQTMRNRLVSRETREKIDTKIEEAVFQIIEGDKNFKSVAESQIEDGFHGKGVSNSIGTRIIVNEIASMKLEVSSHFSSLASRIINSLLLDLGSCRSEEYTGINGAIGLTKALLETVEKLSALNNDNAGLTTSQTAMNEAWNNLEDADTNLANTMKWAKKGRRFAVKGWEDAAKVYWSNRIDAACKNEINEILDNLRQLATKVLIRLQGSTTTFDPAMNPVSLVKIAFDLKALAETKANQMSGQSPKVNGHVIFDTETVNSTYKEFMDSLDENLGPRDSKGVHIHPDRVNEDFARAWVIREWSLLADEGINGIDYHLTSESSHFDKPTVSSTNIISNNNLAQTKLDRLASRYTSHWLSTIYEKDVLKMVLGSSNNPLPEADELLKKVVDAATPFLNLENEAVVPSGRRPKFAFFYQAHSQNTPYSTFKQKLQNAELRDDQIFPLQDRTRATVIIGKMIFPIKYMVGFDKYELQAKNKQDQEAPRNDGRSILESRKDVVWRTLDGSLVHPMIEKMMGLFLFGLACGFVVKNGEGYEASENVPGRILDKDILKSGFHLCHQLQVKTFLQECLKKCNQPGESANAAAKINLFLTQELTGKFCNLTLEASVFNAGDHQNFKGLTMQIESLLLGLLSTEASTIERDFDAYVSKYEPVPETYWDQQRNAYSCPHCTNPENNSFTFVASQGEEHTIKSCPECNRLLLFPGWDRRKARKDGTSFNNSKKSVSTTAPTLSPDITSTNTPSHPQTHKIDDGWSI